MVKAASLRRVGGSRVPISPKVVKADALVLGDEQVARVRVAMEYPKNEDLVQIGVGEILRQQWTDRPHRGIIDPAAAALLLDDDRLANQFADRLGNEERLPFGERHGEPLDVSRLPTEVDLLLEVAPDLVDDAQGLIVPQSRQ